MGKVPLGLRMDALLLERLDRWRTEQLVAPQRTAVIEKALEEFLDRREEGEVDEQEG